MLARMEEPERVIGMYSLRLRVISPLRAKSAVYSSQRHVGWLAGKGANWTNKDGGLGHGYIAGQYKRAAP